MYWSCRQGCVGACVGRYAGRYAERFAGRPVAGRTTTIEAEGSWGTEESLVMLLPWMQAAANPAAVKLRQPAQDAGSGSGMIWMLWLASHPLMMIC